MTGPSVVVQQVHLWIVNTKRETGWMTHSCATLYSCTGLDGSDITRQIWMKLDSISIYDNARK